MKTAPNFIPAAGAKLHSPTLTPPLSELIFIGPTCSPMWSQTAWAPAFQGTAAQHRCFWYSHTTIFTNKCCLYSNVWDSEIQRSCGAGWHLVCFWIPSYGRLPRGELTLGWVWFLTSVALQEVFSCSTWLSSGFFPCWGFWCCAKSLGGHLCSLAASPLQFSLACLMLSIHFIFSPLPSCLGIFCPFSLCCQVVLCCSLLTASVLVLHMVKKRSWQCSITSAKEKDVKPYWIQPWSCFCWDRLGQRPSWVQRVRDAGQSGAQGWGRANVCVLSGSATGDFKGWA